MTVSECQACVTTLVVESDSVPTLATPTQRAARQGLRAARPFVAYGSAPVSRVHPPALERCRAVASARPMAATMHIDHNIGKSSRC